MNRTDGPLLVGGLNENTNISAPLELDNAGNLKVAVTGAGSGGTSSVDRSSFVASTSAGTPAMGVFETVPSTITNGQLGIVAVNANRELKVEVTAGGGSNASVGATGAAVPASATYVGRLDASGNLAGLVSGHGTAATALRVELPTDGTGVIAGITNAVTVTQATAANLNVTEASAAAIAASASVLDDWDETNRAAVNTIAGQVGVQGAAGASTALTQRVAIATDANAVTAVGTIADDATTPGAPVMVGGTAKSPDGTDPGSVSAENDVTRAITDMNRRVFVNDNHPRSLTKHLDGSTAYTDEALIADPGDGFQIVITNIIGSTGAATALNFFLEEGSTKIFGPIYLEAAAGRGFASGPIYLPCTASTAVTLTSSASIAQSFQVNYFIQAV